MNSVDAYLAAVPAGSRAALQKLRRVIKRAAPRATEVVNYGVPMLKLDGKNLVGYGAATAHCAFYVMSPAVMRAHATELKGYPAGKGSIRFPPDRPLPPALVTKLVKARIAEVGKKT